MSFFGQQNNQQQSTGFGGFGASSNTGTGFGQQPASTGGSLFGSGTSTTGGGFGGFGSGVTGNTGFGASSTNTGGFGQAKPAFGSTNTGGGLFGGGTSTTAPSGGGFGGFGATNNNNSTGGGLFGSTPAKPAFGASNTSGGLFGNTGGSAFGTTNNQATGGFGQTAPQIGQNAGECQGTGSTPFAPFQEKEGNTGNLTNHFQSISFMAPYKNFSFEELRLADYNQGRRYGNGSGQAGAFGSTNFSGFGQNNTTGGFGQTNAGGGGLFGQASTAATGFGQTATAGSGFGSTNTGTGLFGAAKPATGGLFGSATTSSQPTGGLFGTAGANTGGFGTTNNAGGGFGNTGGGLFGTGNNATQNQQAKPFSFGTNTATTGTTGFGTTNTGFGTTANNNTGGGLFGNTPAANNANPFGTQQQNNQPSNPFGSGFGTQNQSNTGGGLFGNAGQNNNQQPAATGGLFGNNSTTNTGGGLFGNQNQNNQQQNTGGGLFGNANNNQAAGNSLFGPKPAATGTGLFGQSTTNATNTGGGLFGNNNNNQQGQQNQGGGLFGNTNNQQKPGGLFGNTTNNTGSSLFGNNNNNQQSGAAGGLFGTGNQQPQQQQGGGLFGNSGNNQGSSLFGASQQQPQQPNQFQQQQQTFQTSLSDPNAFGSPSIFAGLPPPPQVTGPIATPISAKRDLRKTAIIPHYKMTPASRYQTPQKRGGYGFSYSSYGTPSSVSSNVSTPGGFNASLYSSVGRSLGKSLSTSNLRRNFDETDSVLSPGAFSAGSSRIGGSSNLKRLTIDRSLRTDLFGSGKEVTPALPSPEKERQPGILKKKVSFDANTVGGNAEQRDGALVNGTDAADINHQPTAEEQGFLRSSRTPAKPKQNLFAQAQSENDQVKGNELAVVHEDASPHEASATSNGRTSSAGPRSQADQQPGDYWMKPSKEDLAKMDKERLRHFSGFSVGRDGCGFVEFDKPVDLTLTKLDSIYDNIVVIDMRSITVYPDPAKKPAQGKGLNVPSTLHLENSWPRQRDKKTPLFETSGPRFNKHVDRLRKVGGTEFVRYESKSGIWVFRVPHFTTYGLDYDDDDASVMSEGINFDSSILSEPPNTPTPKARLVRPGQTPASVTESNDRSLATTSSQISRATMHDSSSPDDTFQFRKKRLLPGAFDEQDLPDADDEPEMEEVNDKDQSFLGERSAASPSDSGVDEPSDLEDAVNDEKERSLIVVEEDDDDMDLEMAGAFPVAYAKTLIDDLENPVDGTFQISGTWVEELQRTISPRKQDRAALREKQALDEDRLIDFDATPTKKPEETMNITSHADLMASIWETRTTPGRKQVVVKEKTGPKMPYSKLPETDEEARNMPEQTRLLHEGYKPHWGPEGQFMFSAPHKAGSQQHSSIETGEYLHLSKDFIISERRDICFSRVVPGNHLTTQTLQLQRANTRISMTDGAPMAHSPHRPFADFAASVHQNSASEKTVWQLASLLFDDQDASRLGIPASKAAQYDYRLRKDRLIEFWSHLCETDAIAAANDNSATLEERAIAYLSTYKLVEASDALIRAKDYRLAILVAQIGNGDKAIHDDMSQQLATWRDLNVLSEMTEPILAIYSLLAGNVCVSEGKKGQLEDRAPTFALSKRFLLDWRRAFGLRLYYGLLASEPVEVAIKSFSDDLASGAEPANPCGDILWGLLQLYAASRESVPLPSLAQILGNGNNTGQSKDTSSTVLSFQLYHALTLRFPYISDAAAGDHLAIDFAAQLQAAGEWLWAIFALLHLTSASQREAGIRELLVLHAANIDPYGKGAEAFSVLTEELNVPESWIWAAKAIYTRSVSGDHGKEVAYLVKAGDWHEAHQVLKQVVGPRCVISEDWVVLSALLADFKKAKIESEISDWGEGGEVYADFLAISTDPFLQGEKRTQVLVRLLDVLPNLAVKFKQPKTNDGRTVEKDSGRQRFEEMVAVKEMSAVVAREVTDLVVNGAQGLDAGKILALPLTKGEFAMRSAQLSEMHYRNVMARS